MPKIARDVIEKLANLGDADKANMFALWGEADELEKQIVSLKKEKGDADQIAGRAAEIETKSKEKDAKIVELQGLLAQHTGKPAEEFHPGFLAPFFGQDF